MVYRDPFHIIGIPADRGKVVNNGLAFTGVLVNTLSLKCWPEALKSMFFELTIHFKRKFRMKLD